MKYQKSCKSNIENCIKLYRPVSDIILFYFILKEQLLIIQKHQCSKIDLNILKIPAIEQSTESEDDEAGTQIFHDKKLEWRRN